PRGGLELERRDAGQILVRRSFGRACVVVERLMVGGRILARERALIERLLSLQRRLLRVRLVAGRPVLPVRLSLVLQRLRRALVRGQLVLVDRLRPAPNRPERLRFGALAPGGGR